MKLAAPKLLVTGFQSLVVTKPKPNVENERLDCWKTSYAIATMTATEMTAASAESHRRAGSPIRSPSVLRVALAGRLGTGDVASKASLGGVGGARGRRP